jgi:hypothetical protein
VVTTLDDLRATAAVVLEEGLSSFGTNAFVPPRLLIFRGGDQWVEVLLPLERSSADSWAITSAATVALTINADAILLVAPWAALFTGAGSVSGGVVATDPAARHVFLVVGILANGTDDCFVVPYGRGDDGSVYVRRDQTALREVQQIGKSSVVSDYVQGLRALFDLTRLSRAEMDAGEAKEALRDLEASGCLVTVYPPLEIELDILGD